MKCKCGTKLHLVATNSWPGPSMFMCPKCGHLAVKVTEKLSEEVLETVFWYSPLKD